MATKRTINFLPSVFQTDTNRKFLAATLDQLVSEPEFVRLDGFIGRKFAPTYKTTDSYIPEPDSDRQSYQLEPSVLVKNSNGDVEFYSNYPDLVNKIAFYGGLTNNHDRLFSNEYYTFNGLFDQDKFVNYQQYFWLPAGPETIQISAEFVESQKTFKIVNDNDDNCIRVEGREDDNPEIVVSRGGLYKFVVSTVGQKFYIQTEPGISGIKTALSNQSTRDIYGVTNNGTDNGTIEFRVPLVDAQDVYLKMPYGLTVDYAVDLSFSSIDGAVWDQLVSQYKGFDGVEVLPVGKTILITNSSTDDIDWTRADGSIVPESLRCGVYKIRITQNDAQQNVINLDYLSDVAVNNRIYVRLGKLAANKEFYLSSIRQYIQIPALTAQLDTLYYQDATNPTRCGKIRLVDSALDTINVDTSIIGKKNYTSPGGIDFTNGMVIQFDNTIEPKKYANKRFVIEGVGKGIRLVNFDNLVSPEFGTVIKEIEWDVTNFDTIKYGEFYKGSILPDYLVMNRGSLDLNAWARQNRWFHIDVINKSAELNNQVPKFDQAVRAQRPIIEFNGDIQLFNNGRIGKNPVNHIDTTHTDAFNQIQNRASLAGNGITFKKGDRILFATDKDPLVRSQVYTIQLQKSYNSIYDGQGAGTISIDPPTIDYLTNSQPEYLGIDSQAQYSWKWLVQGSTKLLSAIRITGLLQLHGTGNGIVTNVTRLSNNQFEILFTTSFSTLQFNSTYVDIIGPGGIVTVKGTDTSFKNEFEEGTDIYISNGVYIGTISRVMQDNKAQLESPSVTALTNSEFWYKKPRIQLVISDDPDDSMQEYDTIVATDGENKGKTFWYDGTRWIFAQFKDAINKPIQFDVFDANQKSFSTYNLSKFTGTKIFSYKTGSGPNDAVLGFPITYTSNYSIADITFYHDFTNDTFQYRQGNTNVTQKVETGFLRQNLGRYDFVKRNTWYKVNEPSHQYQIISATFTGETNYFEIDITGKDPVQTPTIKVFLNNKLLSSTQYRPYVKVNKRNTILISADILTVGDKIDILIYSNETSNIGYYQIPYNLEYNTNNESFVSVTLGQLRNNLEVIGQNADGIIGNVPGNSNLRDINTDEHNGNILQNSAPLIYANLFLINDTANFINGIEYAKKEYSKFKNKFLETCINLKGLDVTDPKSGVDKILATINSVKNKSFPWYYSDMVPYGDAKILKYTILDDTAKRRFRLNSTFDDTKIQSRAILVYLNSRLLIKDVDYKFDRSSPTVYLLDSLITVIGDVIEIKDYQTTDANFIPETPTKLGLYQKFVPHIFHDDTYRDPINVLQGHDGSLTPTFGDFRDQFLLELEKRIFNNIKEDPTKKIFDVRSLIPGRFRTSEYSLNEFNSILNTSFLKWVGDSKINFSKNDYFVNGDPFTYNYRQTKDSLSGEFLPGYWRGVYQYFYDTDKPHSHPWEMLGFTECPTWWQTVYGPAPYTKDNLLLWSDLEEGIIRQGSRAGTDKFYARPGLSQIIPVDAEGNLVPPMVRIATPLNSQTVEQSFVVGDIGPVEAAWRRTSEYPYALQIAAALMKPAMYFGTLIDINAYYKSDIYNQYLYENTNKRITPTSVVVNGESVNGSITRSKGYINWVIDYMTSTGINGITKMRSMLDNLQVQLSYKVAGFIDKKYLTVLAEQYSPTSTNQSVIIPDDSYQIYLNKGVPVDRITYSAVIIEKTNTGYAVSGYNINNPYFVVIPSDSLGDKYTVDVDGFNAVIYRSFLKEKLIFPYGSEFTNKQQVVDFLTSYQRALLAQGFIFSDYDAELTHTRDWILSVKEFLTWAAQGWKSGGVIVLSPVNNVLSVVTTNSVVDQISNTTYGGKLLDPNFNAIKSSEITVLRDSGEFKITSITGKTIAFAEFNLVQYEHVLLFDNTTIFNDILYKPDTGSRQFRLKLVGNKTDNWNGALSIPGFVYNNETVNEWHSGKDYLKGDLVTYKKQYYVATQDIAALSQFDFNYWKQINKSDIKTGLLSNFSNNAGKFINFYDVDSSLLDSQLGLMRSGLIGFRDRSYLTDLNVNQTSQTKFYQGFIKNKGTNQSISNLANASFYDLTNNVNFYEEWAVRVGEYGALASNSTVEILLNEKISKQNPAGIYFGDNFDEKGIFAVQKNEIYNRSGETGSIKFINRKLNFIAETDVQSAGYVNTNDVDATLFDINNYQNLNSSVNDVISGFTLWIGKDYNKDWNVYRANETDAIVQKIEYNLDNFAKVFTKEPHNLASNQLVVIKNVDSSMNGFYIVNNVVGVREFIIELSVAQGAILKKKSIITNGQLFVMKSVRFNDLTEIDNYTPRYGWRDNDLVWVDRANDEKWTVLKKLNQWVYGTSLPIELNNIAHDIEYGTSLKINDRYIIAGAPGDNWNNSTERTGKIHLFDRTTLKELVTVNPVNYKNTIARLGQSLDFNEIFLAVGAPGVLTSNAHGHVVIYKFQDNADKALVPAQVLTGTTTQHAKFGYSVSMSRDGHWLYVGAPGENAVHVYTLVEYRTNYTRYAIDGFVFGCKLPYVLTDINALAVEFEDNLLIPLIDYYIDGDKVRFINPPVYPNTQSRITIIRRSYYNKVKVIQGQPDSEFGYTVKTNESGSLLFVGAPSTNVNNTIQAGTVHLYENNFDDIESMSLVHSFTTTTPSYRARFGSSIDYAFKTGSLYVGAPGYSTYTYSGGAVIRYVVSSDANIRYVQAQEIVRPMNLITENFGSVIKVLDNDSRLAISSTQGTAKTIASLDKKQTTFDGKSTIILDITPGTGAVYLYDYMPGNINSAKQFGTFIFGTEFNAPALNKGDQFGCSIDFDMHEMYIGASFNDNYNINSGAVYLQTNKSGSPIWSVSRKQNLKVDPTSINSIGLYNKATKERITSLDYIDPAKGKLLGLIEQNLNYKTSRDPAMYNAGTLIKDATSINLHWGVQQVGNTWWNLDTVRFIDYEQGELIYRLNNWGTLFPGSTISVYEWIESELTPAEYVATGESGTPLYQDNSKYVQISYADPDSGSIKTKYYFWVSGLTSVNNNLARTISIQGIEDAIRNPKAQSIPYAVLLSDQSIGLFNCDKYLRNVDVILKVDYDNIPNTNLIHSEFELIQEDNKESHIPTRIINKLVDSLAGADASARRVPSILLTQNQIIGLDERQRQTLVLNRLAAIRNLAKFSNSILKNSTSAYKLQNSKKFNTALWFSAEAKPTEYDHYAANSTELMYVKSVPGETILVENDEHHHGLWTLYRVQNNLTLKLIRNQSYRTQDLWVYKNWYKDGFDSGTIPDYNVEYYKDIEQLVIVPGDIVQINNSSTNGFEIYRFSSPTDGELVAVENGTLEINEDIWSKPLEGGFDNDVFENTIFDKDQSTECRHLINGLFEDIFVDDLADNYNKLVFTIIKYILSEQKNVDWVFKTSFISILHKIKQLEQYPNYIRDNHEYFEDYINEIKPYKTKIREYKVSYTGLDTSHTAISDFDLPGYYDRDLNRFRSPNGDYPDKDGILFTKPEYIDWATNFSSGVSSIIINRGGLGYSSDVTVKIVSNGDAGYGATAIAVVNELTGAIVKIHITNSGTGYRSSPRVFISGTGSGADACAQIYNQKIRSIRTTLKFDRVSYNTQVREWMPNTVYNTNDIVSYNGNGYRARFTNTSAVFNLGNFILLRGDSYITANDRVAATYYPGLNQQQKDIDEAGNIDVTRLIPGTTYNAHTVQSYTDVFNETNIDGPIAYDRFTGINPEDINVAGGKFTDQNISYAPEELVAGTTHDSLTMTVSTIIDDPLNASQQKIVKFRIIKDVIGQPTYLAVAKEGTTRLAKDLKYNDTAIYLEDISKIAVPNTTSKIPGYLYINGERIKFWKIDADNNAILYPIRGVDGTAIPLTHNVDSFVEDQSPKYVVPNTTTEDWQQFIFTAQSPVFSPYFRVHPDLRVTSLRLSVYNSVTKLNYGVDYTLELSQYGGVHITFTQAATIKDGVKFDVSYTTEKSWLNVGISTPADGTGLNGSVTPSAIFMKRYTHDLT